jgi:hypothetical protein
MFYNYEKEMIQIGEVQIDKRVLVLGILKISSEIHKHLSSLDIDLIKAAKDNKNFKPELYQNELIRKAWNRQNKDVVDLLWSFDSVKKSLKNDKESLYNILKTQEINNKIDNF